MPFPKNIIIKSGKLPENPGVYFYYDPKGKLLYVGKATSLKRRVSSYFNKTHDDFKTGELVSRIYRIEYETTETVIEALVLEANMIRKFLPPFNIKGKDDKSFLYLCITREKFPRPLMYRGGELEDMGYVLNKLGAPESRRDKKFLAIFGPYTSGPSLCASLKLIRKSIPFCTQGRIVRRGLSPKPQGTVPSHDDALSDRQKTRACFYYHIKQCPGVCVGAIEPKEYRKYIRDLIRIFSGKKKDIIRDLKRGMNEASAAQEYERAALLRNRLYALTHIHDVAVITSERVAEADQGAKLGRIEAYDISNISGTNSVGSMTVAINGEPAPSEYRKFKIRTVKGADDFASMAEVLSRRFSDKNRAAWGVPDLIVIDGGSGQVHAARKVLLSYGLDIPLVGLAKGFDRKQDVLVFDRNNPELKKSAERFKLILQKVRDEAHRFAVAYHRNLRGRMMFK
ncbi:MAG: excinuclease ABC subunit UvrC [bacterium]